MIVACPKCKAKYKVDDAKIGDQGMKLRCSKCSTVFKVMKKAGETLPPKAAAPVPPPQPQAAPPPPPPQPQAAPPPQPQAVPPPPKAPEISKFAGSNILVATSVAEAKGKIDEVLQANGLVPTHVADGIKAYDIIKTERPSAVIIDVMLPKLMGFEICELVKNDPDLRAIPIVLLAAQLNSHRFKRPPKTLYGADAYLEIKDIESMTIDILADLLSGRKPRHPMAESEIFPHGVAASGKEAETVAASPPPPAPEPPPPPVPEPSPPTVAEPTPPPAAAPDIPPEEQAEHEKAKRLARIIVSDIKLYNQDAVTEGVQNGTFFDLLAKDIGDARKLYEQRIPENIRAKTDYLEESFQKLINDKKKELGLI